MTRPEDDGEIVACMGLAFDVEVGSTTRAVGIACATSVRFGRGMAKSAKQPLIILWFIKRR